MTISTTILQAYDACKQIYNTDTCKQRAMEQAPSAVKYFLDAYDLCLSAPGVPKEMCQKAFAYDIPTPPIIPFIIGIALGWVIKRR